MPLNRKTIAITWVVILISIPVIGVSCHFWAEHRQKLEWRSQFAAERKAKAEAERKGLQYYDALRLDARERKYDSSIVAPLTRAERGLKQSRRRARFAARWSLRSPERSAD